MDIDFQWVPSLPISDTFSNRTVVVIDVLRATSVIVRVLSLGAQEVLPVTTVDEAFQLVRRFPSNMAVLGGERGGRKVEGFDLGNSPEEYVAEKVRGKSLVFTTTNGTKAFSSVSSGAEVLVGSFLNIGAAAERCLSQDHDLLIFPAGDEGKFSLEDAVCGGMLIDLVLKKGKKSVVLSDASYGAHVLYQRFEENLLEVLRISNHGKDLIHLGFWEDLLYCAQVDLVDIVPVFRNGVIRVCH